MQKWRELYADWEQSKQPDALRKLFEAGCTPSTVVNSEKDTLLHAAARHGNLDVRHLHHGCLLTTEMSPSHHCSDGFKQSHAKSQCMKSWGKPLIIHIFFIF
jgi:hypothetical protein